jgi:hypothetical protein
MKIFITLLVLVIIGLGAWALWSGNGNNASVVIRSNSNTPVPSSASAYVTNPPLSVAVTPKATATPTPRRTASPTPQGQGGTGTIPPRAPIFATLDTINGSGESGVVALTANGNDLATLTFNMTGYPAGASQRVDIVNGTCVNPGDVAYELTPLMNGASMSTININFLDLAQSKDQLAIMVYSPDEQTQYACGQLR